MCLPVIGNATTLAGIYQNDNGSVFMHIHADPTSSIAASGRLAQEALLAAIAVGREAVGLQ